MARSRDADKAPVPCAAAKPVALMISASVTPLAHFIVAINFAFLLAGSAFGLPGPLRPPSSRASLSCSLADGIDQGADPGAGLLLYTESVVLILSHSAASMLRSPTFIAASDKQQAEVRATRAE